MAIEPLEARDVDHNKHVGREIKAWLARKDMRQRDLAVALGLSQGAVSQRLIGKVSFSVEELMQAAGLLDITLGDLLGGDVLNKKGPRPAVRDEDSEKLPQLDSNQQPFD